MFAIRLPDDPLLQCRKPPLQLVNRLGQEPGLARASRAAGRIAAAAGGEPAGLGPFGTMIHACINRVPNPICNYFDELRRVFCDYE